MEYREYKPLRLNNLVKSIYERKVDIRKKMQFLPDGTVTLIFNISQGVQSAKGENIDSKLNNPTRNFCFISGLHTKPLYLDLGGHHVVGLIMYPAAVKAFFGMPTIEVKDIVFEGVFIKELEYIENEIKALDTFMQRAYWLENHFYKKLNKAADLDLALKLNHTVQKIKSDVLKGERLDITSYSGYSKMHTHRIFKEWLGLTPGKLIRYTQFLDSIKLIHQSNLSLTQIGFECGFFDQAHFIRVFEEFAKMTPSEYRKKKTTLPGILPW